VGIDEAGSAAQDVADRAVSVVIPAFNEGPHVGGQVRAVLAAVRASGWPFEVIVVDDGSTDETAKAAGEAGATVIRQPANQGYGAALKRGIASARHDWILITDADTTYPAAAIPRLLERAEGNEMVVGARTGPSVEVESVRVPAKWILTRLASFLAGRKIPDLNSGMRLMRRDLVQRYEHLLPQGFSFTTTITLACACNGHATEFVPIDYGRRLGRSKIRVRHAFDFLLLILRLIVLFHPLKVFLPAGSLLLVGGLAKLAWDGSRGELSEGAVAVLLGALILWGVGLLADRNARRALRR
jgi:glycosyltransferase involved in cell wall biosynthesis